MNTLTEEEINQIKECFDKIINTINNILDTVIETISNIFEELKNFLNKDCLIIKKKRKGNRIISYFIKEKLYKLLLSYQN
ncbi:MAG: hypothetical protein ACI4VE_05640 [Clostridia bacterium]